MNDFITTTRRSAPRYVLRMLALVLSLSSMSAALFAQERTAVVGNDYVQATLTADTASPNGGGRFVISGGGPDAKFLFLYYISSTVVFRVVGPTVSYFTNARAVLGSQPMVGGKAVEYRAFDSLYESSDTIAVGWRNLAGMNVTMRLVPEKPLTQYDRGSDVLIEFEYAKSPGSSADSFGVFMMLDLYNGQAQGASGGDKSSVLCDRGYYPSARPGRRFAGGPDSLPQFYHVGNFKYEPPLNVILPVHRLRGTSHNGARLNAPEYLTLGNWRVLRYAAWDAEPGSGSLGDCASAMQWERSAAPGLIRTAFGMDNREGNDLYHCRDSKLFVDVRTIRAARQDSVNGPWSPARFDVDVWVTNTDSVASSPSIRLAQPIGGPVYPGAFTLDPSTPLVVQLSLAPYETRRVRWGLNVAGVDRQFDIPLRIEFGLESRWQDFKQACEPLVTLLPNAPPALDSLPPVFERRSRTSSGTVVRVAVFDRHTGYRDDTGLGRVEVALNKGNMRYSVDTAFVRCDTASTHIATVSVIDSTNAGWIMLVAADCFGNVSADTVEYTPPVAGIEGAGVSGRLAIIGIRPMPIRRSAGAAIDLELADVGSRGAVATLIGADGSVLRTYPIAGGAGQRRVVLPLPEGIAAGWYVLRVEGERGSDAARIIVD